MKKNELTEQWLRIASTNYEVSNLGNVRNTSSNKILTPLSNGQKENDYLFVMLDGKKYYIAHLVLAAFIGKRPLGYECDHINSDKQDNRLSNLRYLIRAENRSHKGEKHGMAKLTTKLVKAIKGLVARGLSQKDVAELYEVSASTISSVITGRTWNHVV